MSGPSEQHFGHAQLARLVQLQQTTTPADLEPVTTHWQDHPLVVYLPPLSWPTRLPGYPKRTNAEMAELREEYRTAFRTRTKFAELFIGTAPFFETSMSLFNSDRLGCREQDVGLCQDIIQQGQTQLSAAIFQNWPSLFRTLVQPGEGSEHATPFLNNRPFIRLMLEPNIAALLYRYVEYVAIRMAKSCRSNPGASSPVIWLGFKQWRTITFYDRARIVLAAREYEEYIRKAAHAHRSGLGAGSVEVPWHLQFPPLASLSHHQHAPNLTSRQARRSNVSQEKLRRRWGTA